MCPWGAVFLQYSLSVVSSERLLENDSFSTASKGTFSGAFVFTVFFRCNRNDK